MTITPIQQKCFDQTVEMAKNIATNEADAPLSLQAFSVLPGGDKVTMFAYPIGWQTRDMEHEPDADFLFKTLAIKFLLDKIDFYTLIAGGAIFEADVSRDGLKARSEGSPVLLIAMYDRNGMVCSVGFTPIFDKHGQVHDMLRDDRVTGQAAFSGPLGALLSLKPDTEIPDEIAERVAQIWQEKLVVHNE